MTIHLQEVVRSEVEGGLTGPANPIPRQSIDCGCGQLRCPKLAKFATRRLFVGLLSWVGLVQAAAYAYFYVTGPTIARRFQFDPYTMEWVLVISDLTPFVVGVLTAYWGDKIHRAAWIGGIVLLQSVSYFIMIIPHLTHQTMVVDETENITHMSLTSDDSPELCSRASSRLIATEDESCYFTFGVTVAVQIIAGIANVAYFALGISYLDDNTKKRHVASFIGIILSVKIIGVLLGYILAWSCLKLDAVTLNPIESYREQIGAWWLGLPILTVLLVVPGLLLSWFPRMLPSEVVEQAAASLLNTSSRYNRVPRRLTTQKVGSPTFWPSVGRLVTNKILICNIMAYNLYMMAIVNFMGYENLIIQARFHVPKPTGMLLGFSDPIYSRLISNILKPVLIGLIVTLSGLIIAKAKPNVKYVVGYGIVVALLSAGIIFALTATYCEKKPIVGTDSKGSLFLPKYCNKDCGCSNDADFRPVCDSKGMFTFYSPCHAGCTSREFENGLTAYSGCSCVEEMTGLGNKDARDGPCGSNACQVGWLIFQFGTLLAYALVATTFVGDFLIVLRSAYAQDKAISIGLWMAWSAVFVNIPGKFIYDTIANVTCQYWGTTGSTCRLHDSLKLGDYLCYLTGSLLVLCALVKLRLWFFCRDLKLYVEQGEEVSRGAEMQELIRNPALAPKQQTDPPTASNNNNTSVQVEVANETAPKTTEENSETEEAQRESSEAPLKYGPLGPGNRRTDLKSSPNQTAQRRKSRIRNLDSEDELSSSDEDCKKRYSPIIAYRPLDIDSDIESNLSTAEPRSRKRIHSRDYDRVYNSDQSSSVKGSLPKREFPNPDNYEDPRLSRRTPQNDQSRYLDGSSKTSSFEFSNRQGNDKEKKGDFNEVGIPIVNPPILHPPNPDSRFLKDVKSLINQYEHNSEQQTDGDQSSVRSAESGRPSHSKIVSGIPLIAMASKRPSSTGQSSSGFSSLLDGKVPEDRSESRASNSPKTSVKGSRGTLHTNL